MSAETPEQGDEARRDDAATERPESPSEHQGQSDQPGGPRGNPEVDEESLRKRQEESSERSDDAVG
jgi:hypothetical protein